MVENMKKLAWGARGSWFESNHPDTFFSGTYDQPQPHHKSLFLSQVVDEWIST